MNYSFEYIDIILLAMIAGFIFLRLRGILGKRTGFEGKAPPQFEEILKNIDPKIKTNKKQSFDEEAQKDFLKGAKIAYETIITDFSDDDNKLVKSKPLLSKKIQDQFNRDNNITPQTISKSKDSIMAQTTVANDSQSKDRFISELNIDPVIKDMESEEIEKIIQKNEVEMNDAAKKLDFYEAARLRDEIIELKKIIESKS